MLRPHMQENTFYSKRTHSIAREHILQYENTFYSKRHSIDQTSDAAATYKCKRTHSIVREHTYNRTHSIAREHILE